MSYFESSSVLLGFNWLDLVCLNRLSSYLFEVFSGQSLCTSVLVLDSEKNPLIADTAS